MTHAAKQDFARAGFLPYFLAGAAGTVGVAGADWVWVGAFCITEFDVAFVAQMASVTEVAIKTAPSTQVILARVVTAPRGPKAAWLEPPKAAAISTFSPPWMSTITISRTLETTWRAVTATTIENSFQTCSPSGHFSGRRIINDRREGFNLEAGSAHKRPVEILLGHQPFDVLGLDASPVENPDALCLLFAKLPAGQFP